MDSSNPKSNSINSILKSAFVFKVVEGYKYALKISNTKTTAVSVLKTGSNGNGKSWLLRVDNPHKNALFPHINLRHKYTGIADPHLPLPPGAITVAKGGAYLTKALDWICYATIFIDSYQLANAVYKDHQEGTTHHTTECATDKTGQYLGGFVGATVGKTVGAMLIPGIGPLVGALALGIVGVTYGSQLAPKAASCVTYYWRGGKSEEQREKELMRILFFSRLHANKLLAKRKMLFIKL